MTSPTNQHPNVSGGDALQIVLDVGNGVPPDQSKIDYGPAELEFRKTIEEQLAAYQSLYPHASLDARE